MTNDTENSVNDLTAVTSAQDLEIKKIELRIESRRSAVRVWVTYGVIFGYLGLTLVVVGFLMWNERFEIAISVLGGVAGLAGSITGFWFGSRSPRHSQPETESRS